MSDVDPIEFLDQEIAAIRYWRDRLNADLPRDHILNAAGEISLAILRGFKSVILESRKLEADDHE